MLPTSPRSHRCLVLCSPLLAVVVTTQEPAPATRPAVRTLCVQNVAPSPRAEGVAVVVPFAAGTVPERPDLHVRDTATEWQPFGARWADGSVRQALCLFRAELGALQERSFELVPGPGPDLPSGAIDLPPAQIEFVVTQGGVTTRGEPLPVGDLEVNALRRVQLRRARLGASGLVGELVVTAWRDQPQAAVDVAVFCSDPSTPALQCQVDEVAVESRGMALVLHHPGRFGIDQRTTEYGSRNVLLRDQQIGDGQGIRRTGALVPPRHGADDPAVDATSAAACIAPVLGATSWQDSAAFGPFGFVPTMPPWLQGPLLRAHFAKRHRAFVDSERPGGDPFAVGKHGLDRMAGQTGDQGDFGTVKLSTVAASGIPSFLLEVEAAILQEGCRPVHFFEANGAPVEPADHPQWVVWSGRTHWHTSVSPDRLGKHEPQPPFDNHGWTGKDRQHWSSNYLGAFAQLTGSHWARLELQNEVRLYLAGQTIDPRLTTSGPDAARGAGRTELAAAWMWLATGDERLRTRMNERIDRVYHPSWAGRDLGTDRVRTMSVCQPDDRLLQGKFTYWNPWQDAIAAVGFGAAFGVTGNPRARELAEELAMNVVRFGWLLTPTECEVGIAMRWQDGVPLTEAQRTSGDPTVLHWGYGTAYSEWSVAACEIARVTAEARGDTPLAERAAAIQQRLRSHRRQPGPGPWDFGGIDRLTEWDAVRWTPP